MYGKWGRAWLAAVVITFSLICVPLPGRAADAWSRAGALPFLLAGTNSPMEAQMLGEKPFQAQPVNPGAALIPGAPSVLHYNKQGGASLRINPKMEMNISVLYNRDERNPASLDYQKRSDSLLMKYSLDYRLLPNLKVGLNAYLYRPDPGESLSLTGALNDRVMGMGPGLKYDLGRWSFLLKSQVETGDRKDMQNWFRVWYAF
jgi:hypothetical protein